MDDTDPTDISEGARELTSLERDIAERDLEDPKMPSLADRAEVITGDLEEDVERSRD